MYRPITLQTFNYATPNKFGGVGKPLHRKKEVDEDSDENVFVLNPNIRKRSATSLKSYSISNHKRSTYRAQVTGISSNAALDQSSQNTQIQHLNLWVNH